MKYENTFKKLLLKEASSLENDDTAWANNNPDIADNSEFDVEGWEEREDGSTATTYNEHHGKFDKWVSSIQTIDDFLKNIANFSHQKRISGDVGAKEYGMINKKAKDVRVKLNDLKVFIQDSENDIAFAKKQKEKELAAQRLKQMG